MICLLFYVWIKETPKNPLSDQHTGNSSLVQNLMYEKMQNYRAVIRLWNMHYALDAVLGAAEAR